MGGVSTRRSRGPTQLSAGWSRFQRLSRDRSHHQVAPPPVVEAYASVCPEVAIDMDEVALLRSEGKSIGQIAMALG